MIYPLSNVIPRFVECFKRRRHYFNSILFLQDDNKTLEKVDDRLEKPVVEKGVSLQHSTVDKAKGERCKSAKSPDTVEEGNVDSPVVVSTSLCL